MEWIAEIPHSELDANNFYSVFRAGSQTRSASNTGYISVGGINGANAIHDCFENGSAAGLSSQEPTKPGLATSTGLEARLKAADGRDCYSWTDVMQSLKDANSGGGAALDGTWKCSPHTDQRTSIVLVPVIETDFLNLDGKTTVEVYMPGDQYLLAYFWLDGDRTFDQSKKNWKFFGPAGQADVEDVFLSPHLTMLGSDAIGGSGSVVSCTVGESISCFAQLID